MSRALPSPHVSGHRIDQCSRIQEERPRPMTLNPNCVGCHCCRLQPRPRCRSATPNHAPGTTPNQRNPPLEVLKTPKSVATRKDPALVGCGPMHTLPVYVALERQLKGNPRLTMVPTFQKPNAMSSIFFFFNHKCWASWGRSTGQLRQVERECPPQQPPNWHLNHRFARDLLRGRRRTNGWRPWGRL